MRGRGRAACDGKYRDRASDVRADATGQAKVVDHSESPKSYADRRQSELEFLVGDLVLLKVSPWKGVI